MSILELKDIVAGSLITHFAVIGYFSTVRTQFEFPTLESALILIVLDLLKF